MPPQPAVPVVIKADSGASARMAAFSPSQGSYERDALRRCGPRDDLAFLTDSDLHLIHASTGERIWRGAAATAAQPVTAFTGQIALDRRTGTLRDGTDVTAIYLVRTGSVIEANGGVNPFSGLHLERALAYLAGRCDGRVDIIC